MIIEFPPIPTDDTLDRLDKAEASCNETERSLENQLADVRQIRENIRAARRELTPRS